MWVPLIENREHQTEGAKYFIKKYLDQLMERSGRIDTILLACTHYPLILDEIREYVGKDIQVIPQGEIVSLGLQDYLKRHPEMNALCLKTGERTYYTSDDTANFNAAAELFFGESLSSVHLPIGD